MRAITKIIRKFFKSEKTTRISLMKLEVPLCILKKLNHLYQSKITENAAKMYYASELLSLISKQNKAHITTN